MELIAQYFIEETLNDLKAIKETEQDKYYKKIISRLVIKYGVPIVAKRGLVSGYYIPANDQERLEGIRELNAQYNQEGKRLNVLISADLQAYKEFLDGTI